MFLKTNSYGFEKPLCQIEVAESTNKLNPLTYEKLPFMLFLCFMPNPDSANKVFFIIRRVAL